MCAPCWAIHEWLTVVIGALVEVYALSFQLKMSSWLVNVTHLITKSLASVDVQAEMSESMDVKMKVKKAQDWTACHMIHVVVD
jgi:hypothetical protein